MRVHCGCVRFYWLDGSRNRREAVPCLPRAGGVVLMLEPCHRTVWYEAKIR
ncbi:MAG: hypothetical protein GXY83_04200 [Rhodopirellula sp.]|nr:hypothetical protein [Rhodopirellula sp.]